jgi:hypothetical protein
MPLQSSHVSIPPHGMWTEISAHRAFVSLSLLVVASFLLRVLTLLRYPIVDGDPLVHYEYSMALLNGKLSVPISTGSSGGFVELYYPPLFHLISLVFFLAFPTVDPYMIMKIVASAFAALEIVPVYLIVKRVSGSSAGGLLASYALLATRSDCEMLHWGGYANVAGLFLAASLVYVVMTERLVLSGILSAALGLTHQLSTLFMVAVLVPYFAILLARKRQISKSLIGVSIGGAIAYVGFYAFAWQSMYYYYSNFAPVYDQSLYVTSAIINRMGPLLLLSAALALAYVYVHHRQALVGGREVLLIWLIAPFGLAYAYLFGVQWPGLRWVNFIPLPLAVWAGLGLGYLDQKKILLIAFAILFTIQLLLYIAGIF